MPQLCEDDRPVGPHIWEWTRYCVQSAHRERARGLSPVANALVSGIVEWGLASGISTIIMEMNPLWLLRLVQMHFRTTPLGLPKPIGGQDTVAVKTVFDRRTLGGFKWSSQHRLSETSGATGQVSPQVFASPRSFEGVR